MFCEGILESNEYILKFLKNNNEIFKCLIENDKTNYNFFESINLLNIMINNANVSLKDFGNLMEVILN